MGPNQDKLYFRQLLSGRDFARTDSIAQQMVNFVYAIGDRESGEALLVDPAYAIKDLLGVLGEDDMKCVGVLGTHFHPDHLGGDMAGFKIEGIGALLEIESVPIHVHENEIEWVTRTTGVSKESFVGHLGSDLVKVGDIEIELVHTPGHTPGSQCFLVDGHLISGDTLFLDGCGRTDFPGSDPEAMYDSLTNKLSRIPDTAVVFPGHRYSSESFATMGTTRATNFVFRPQTAEQWLSIFGG